LACIRRFQLRARLGLSVTISALPPHRPERAELPHSVPHAGLPALAQACALASSDSRLSAVNMVLDLGVSPCVPESGRPDVRPFPPVGSGDASSPPSSVLRASKTPPRPSRRSSVSLDHAVPPPTAETRRSPTFVGNPSESVPRARDSGGSTRASHGGSRDAAFR
jgi:hypothetical protein